MCKFHADHQGQANCIVTSMAASFETFIIAFQAIIYAHFYGFSAVDLLSLCGVH